MRAFQSPPGTPMSCPCPQGGGVPSLCLCRCRSGNRQPGLRARQPGLRRGRRARHGHLLCKSPRASSCRRTLDHRAHLCLCVCRRARTNPRTLMSTPFTHGRATPSHTPTDALHAHGTRAHLQVPPSGAGTSVCSPSHTSSLSGDAAAPCPRHPPQPRAHVWPCAQRGLGRCLESRCAQPPGPRGGPG